MEKCNSSVSVTSLGERAHPEQPLSGFCSLDRASLAADPRLAPPVPREILVCVAAPGTSPNRDMDGQLC